MREDDKVNAVVGENLRRLRAERGMTRVALAEKAGFDDSYLGKMERGRRGTSGGGYQRLADALGVELPTLFARPEPGIASPTPIKKRSSRRSKVRHARTMPRAAVRA
jgi:transcriptional regulator with XRE-family HTH domain